jgi:hypothetical protein
LLIIEPMNDGNLDPDTGLLLDGKPSAARLSRRSADGAEYEAEREQHDERKEDHLRDPGKSGRNDAEAEKAGNDGNNQKCDGPTEHGMLSSDGD